MATIVTPPSSIKIQVGNQQGGAVTTINQTTNVDSTAREIATSSFRQANSAYYTANSAYNNSNTKVSKSGDTMTGSLILSGEGTDLKFSGGSSLVGNEANNSITLAANNLTGLTGVSVSSGDGGLVQTYSNGRVEIITDSGAAGALWTFSRDGSLIFPNGTIQTTAFTGYATDNTARITANAAFIQANASFLQANTPSYVANSAGVYANGAFAQANSANTLAQAAYNAANAAGSSANVVAAFLQANAAFIQANSANTLAANSYIQANASFIQANSANTLAFNSYIQANSAYNKANSANILAQAAFDNSNTKFNTSGGTITGSITINQDASILGNLYVIGNTTSINTSSFTVQDSLLVLGLGNYTTDLLDIGFASHYNAGVNAHTGLIRDSDTKEWMFFEGYTPEVTPNNNIIITDPSFRYANVTANNYKGNVIANNVTINGYNVFSYITNAYTQANSASTLAANSYIQANAAFIQANTPSYVANSAGIYANGAFAMANAAFAQANTGGGGSGSSSGYLNNSVIFANTNGYLSNTSNLQFYSSNNTLSVSGNVIIGGTTASTSNSTGALIVAGGIGSNGAIYTTGGSITINNGLVTTGNSGTIFLGDGTFTKTYGSSWSFPGSGVTSGSFTATATGSVPNFQGQLGSNTTVSHGLVGTAGVGMYFPTNGLVGLAANSSNALFVSAPAGGVNYLQVTGSNTGNAVIFSAQGTDTNISQVLQSKGTGAIDLAAGSSGVNISNGGTVTAITRTSAGGSYTSPPTVAISAPTTAGGVQATATSTLTQSVPTIVFGGTGYSVNDILTFVGGTFTVAAAVTVTAVSGGVITAISTTTFGVYTVVPSNPISVTGGTGTGATLSTTWAMQTTFNITNAGSGYVEQPTVTFSGGGGGGAAAYATVGSSTLIKFLGTVLDFSAPGGTAFRVEDVGSTSTAYWRAIGGATNANFRATASVSGSIQTASAVPLVFSTNAGTSATEQFRIAHTASAVNYQTITGSATTFAPVHSVAGSDANISLAIQSKGTGAVDLAAGSSGVNISNGGTVTAITRTASGSNYTTNPTPSITAPTTAGGVQAVATCTISCGSATVSAGGSGYVVGEILTVVGGTNTVAAVLTVATVSGTAVATVNITTNGTYTASPTNPAATTSNLSGTGATFTLNFSVSSGFTITNAGSGYVEQPTVTFSGGSGSGAAAYATVGSIPTVRSIGSAISFVTPGGEQFRVNDNGSGTTTDWVQIQGSNFSRPAIRAVGAASSSLAISSNGSGSVQIYTNATANEQLRVSHTASAVNYAQVTGGATGTGPTLSSQGSDTNADLNLAPKNTGKVVLAYNSGQSGLGFANATSVIASYTYYNQGSNSMDTVFA